MSRAGSPSEYGTAGMERMRQVRRKSSNQRARAEDADRNDGIERGPFEATSLNAQHHHRKCAEEEAEAEPNAKSKRTRSSTSESKVEIPNASSTAKARDSPDAAIVGLEVTAEV